MEVPPEGLIGRLLASEVAYTATRAAVIGRWAGNPFGVAMRRDGGVFACQVKGVPSPWLNRAIGLGDASAGLVPGLAAWFAEAGISGRFEVTPDGAGPEVARALLAACHALAGGMDIVWARCRFLSQSHRNLQRGGLRTLCTTTFWR